MAANKEPRYLVLSVEDINGLLPFNKRAVDDLKDEYREEVRVREELSMFTAILRKHTRRSIKYIGEEKSFGKHLERFLFYHSGFMEIIVEPPLVLKAHFLDRHDAERFEKALRKAFGEIIPESPMKKMFIDSISLDFVKADPIPMDKWEKMHHIYIQRSVVFTLVAVFIVILFEGIKAITEYFSLIIFGIEESMSVTVVAAIIIAFLFEPIKKRTEHLVETYLFR